jgi:hypothetical protein
MAPKRPRHRLALAGRSLAPQPRETDGYVGLQVDMFADQAELSRRLGRSDEARALANAWITLAARTHTDRHIERAAAFVTRADLNREAGPAKPNPTLGRDHP